MKIRVLTPLVALVLPALASAQSVARLADLEFKGDVPNLEQGRWLATSLGHTLLPRVAIKGEHAVLGTPRVSSGIAVNVLPDALIAIDGKGFDAPLEGTLFLSDPNGTRTEPYRFILRPEKIRLDEDSYRSALAAHNLALVGTALPGAPWFRRQALAHGADLSEASTFRTRRSYRGDDAFAMFTGGQALAENLRLDDTIFMEGGDPNVMTLAEVEGVRVPEIDFKVLLRGKNVKLDALAASIPADQHAVFFPSFDALLEVADELAREAAPLVQFFDDSSGSTLVRKRYEAQMLLELDAFGRALGRRIVRTAALTGSDPYMRTGTDVAVLFLCTDDAGPQLLQTRFEAEAGKTGLEAQTVTVEGVRITGWQDKPRTVSCWIARAGAKFVVANSRQQIEAIVRADRSRTPSLSEVSEYKWFRDRYPRGGDEDAFIVVPDAAIRRWASPAWRIATARRIQAGAVLSDADAWRLAGMYGAPTGTTIATESGVRGGGSLHTDEALARDEVYGTRGFLTPIAELALDPITASEARGYERWRNRFERSFGGAFDPIGAKIDLREDGIDVDLTVLPLTLRSDYRDFARFSGDVVIDEKVPGPHREALAYFALCMDRESEFGRLLDEFGRSTLGIEDPWFSNFVALWVEDDPDYFETLADGAPDVTSIHEEHLPNMPIGLMLGTPSREVGLEVVKAIEAVLRQGSIISVPTNWVTFDGVDVLTADLTALEGFVDAIPTLHLVALDQGILFTFSAKVVKRALGRTNAPPVPTEWVGRSFGAHFDGELQHLLTLEGFNRPFHAHMRKKAWGNLPILNVFKRFGAPDPVAAYEQQWGVRLVCPAGGAYEWNDEDQTMESTLYGHPGNPRSGPALPLSLQTLASLGFTWRFERFQGLMPERRGREGEGRRDEEVLGLRAALHLRR